MSVLWTLEALLEATGGTKWGACAAWFHGVSIDSRQIASGDLFVAIRGDRFDGHDFVEAAIEAGAGAALVSKANAKKFKRGLPLIVVEDAYEALYDIARAARARSGARIVAVTGSVGKTSTKEAIRIALQTAGKTHASVKSFNNHWGVPLTLARLPEDADFGVFEIGMNHAGEIAPLSRLVRPHVAVATVVAEAHLENFENIEGIARAKAEIFEGVEEGGLALLGSDHSHLGILRDAAEARGLGVLTYGLIRQADVHVQLIKPAFGEGEIRLNGRVLPLRLSQSGAHALINAAAAFAVTAHLGGDLDRAKPAIEAAGAVTGRGQVHRLGSRIVLIDESYNANPASMRAALTVFSTVKTAPEAQRVLVLGEMRELGIMSNDLHARLLDPVLDAAPDRIFLVGGGMRPLANLIPEEKFAGLFPGESELRWKVLESLRPGDLVMVKGSNGVGLGALVSAIIENYPAE